MKKVFVLLLMIALSAPAFAVPGYKENMERVGKENIFYDDSAAQTYFDKLEKDFFERHPNGSFTGEQYDKEVRVPYYDYSAKLQKMGYPGYIH